MSTPALLSMHIGFLLLLLPLAAFAVRVLYLVFTKQQAIRDTEFSYWMWCGSMAMNLGLLLVVSSAMRALF